MGKYDPSKSSSNNKEPYKYPSRFGSHTSMLVKDKKASQPGFVVLEDENGTYETEESRLDSGMADPNRYVPSRLKILASSKAEEK